MIFERVNDPDNSSKIIKLKLMELSRTYYQAIELNV